MNYPLLPENIELRYHEREALYQAVQTDDQRKRKKYLSSFIHCRGKRRKYIGKFLDYELAVETIEGPAFYVEFQATKHFTKQSHPIILRSYDETFSMNEKQIEKSEKVIIILDYSYAYYWMK